MPANNKDMLGRSAIVSLAEAQERLQNALNTLEPTEVEEIALEAGLQRILGQSLRAPEDMPPHPRSTMDGYAIRAQDSFGASEGMPVYLTVSGGVPMGTMPHSGPKELECFAIATGGFLPPGTDAVIMLEHTIAVDEHLIELTKAVAPGENIIAQGDDVAQGTIIMPRGKKVRPQEIGVLAGLGLSTIPVHRQVRVGLFSTGDEIVAADREPPPGKIRDLNGAHLSALVRQNRAQPSHYGIAPDEEEHFTALLLKAIEENDLVLFSGSSSVGTRDMGEGVIQKIAQPGILIHGVAIKPGKPVIVALAGTTPLFGLPGHPVSAAVAFDLFVRPAINHLSGQPTSFLPNRRFIEARLSRNMNSAAGRTDFIRVRIRQTSGGTFEAQPVLGKSGALSTMVEADGYTIIPESSQGLKEGDIVKVAFFE